MRYELQEQDGDRRTSRSEENADGVEEEEG